MLTLGGDHSIGTGSVAGILSARPETGVVWLDAHADINTPEVRHVSVLLSAGTLTLVFAQTSPSGNTHGMPVAFLMKLIDHLKVPGMQWLSDVPTLKTDQVRLSAATLG